MFSVSSSSYDVCPCMLKVSTDIEGKNSWLECFSVNGVRLPTGYYFGVTAATGDLSGK